jgi:hypothetical protein
LRRSGKGWVNTLKLVKNFSWLNKILENKRGIDKKYLKIWAFVGISDKGIKDFVLKVIEFMGNNIDTILNISLLISFIILYINIPKVITILMEKKENKEVKIKKWKKIFKFIFWFLFLTIFCFFYFDYLYPELFPLNTTSYVTKRTLKFILAIILNVSNLYINLKTNGFKSWRTFFSIFSLLSTLFFISIFCSEDMRDIFKQVVWKIMQTCITIKVIWDIYIIQKQWMDIFGLGPKISLFYKKPEGENVMFVKSLDEQKVLKNKEVDNQNSKDKIHYSNSRIEKKKENIFNDRKSKIKERKELIFESKRKKVENKFLIEKKKLSNFQQKKLTLDTWLENKERRRLKKQLNEEKKWLYYHTPEGQKKQRLKKNAFSIVRDKKIDYDKFDPLWNELTDWIDEPADKKEKIIVSNSKETRLYESEIKSVKWARNLEDLGYHKVESEKDRAEFIPELGLEKKEEAIEWVKSKDERRKYTDEVLKRRKISRVKYFINEEGKKVYYRKFHKPSYINYDKYKVVSDNINIVNMEYPKNLADKWALRKILSDTSPSKIQKMMYEKQNPLTVLPKVPDYSKLNNLVEYIPTLEKAKERELILIRLILLKVTFFENEYVAGDLLSQLIEVQSKISYLEKKSLNISESIEKKKIKKFNLKLFNFKTPKLEEMEQEYAYLKHPSVTVLTTPEEYEKWKDKPLKENKSILKKGLSFFKNFKTSNLNDTNVVIKPNRPLLPETFKYNKFDINPPKLVLTPHEELYKLYYGERKLRDYEIPAKHIIMETDVTVNYRDKQYKDWIINLESWAAQHPKVLASIAEHKDLKKIVSKHSDYAWLHKKYLLELQEKTIAMKKSQLELSNKNNKAILIKERAKHIEGVKLNKNKDLPPLPILEGKNKLSYKKENYIRVDKNLDEDGNDERWKFFEELLIRWGKEAEESKDWTRSLTPVIPSTTELEEMEEKLPIMPFKRSKEKILIETIENVESEIKEDIKNEREESEYKINELKSVGLEEILDEEYKLKEESVKSEKEEFEKENNNLKDESSKPLKSIEEMTADELEEFLAPEIKRRQEMSDYWRKGIEDICGKIPDELKKYGDKWDEVTPYVLKAKRWQEYYERNAYRLEASYYNPERFPDPVEDPESTVPSESGSVVESIDETDSDIETSSLKSNESDNSLIGDSKNESYVESIKNKDVLKNSESLNLEKELNNTELIEPELVIEYTPNYYHWKKLMGEDALLVRQIEEKCRQEAIKKVESAKAAAKIIEDKRIAEVKAKEKMRQDLIDNGLDPDNPNELWVNGKAVETVCIAILDRAIGGLEYKMNKIDWEREWRENAHILYLDLAMAWDTLFNGGSYEEKLGPEFFANVDKRREIWRKREEIIELKNIFISWRDRLKILQAKSIIGPSYTDNELSDLDDERIFWLQEIVDNPKRQTEVIKYIQDYIDRVNSKKVKKEHLTHEQVIHFVEVYISEQKAGLLNLKPFKEMKPDFMTLRYVDHFLQLKENERIRWAEQKLQAKKDAEIKAAELAAIRAKITPEEIRAARLAEEEYWEKEMEWIIEKEAEIAQLKKEVAEYHLEQEKKQEKSW